MTTRFDRDTEVRRTREGVYEARLDPGWWVRVGPNGGYLGAILLRALEQAVGDPSRAPRSLTVHYTSSPHEGTARIHTCVERAGRSLTSVSARMFQDDRLQAIALAAFSRARQAPEFQHTSMPEVLPPDQAPPLPTVGASGIRERLDSRAAYGAPPFTLGERAESGGWLRLAEPRVVDAPLVVLLADGWPPAIYTYLERSSRARGVPTIDLTVHFRATLPLPGARAEDFTLAVFRTRVAREGFIEEDGEIWSQDGVLLAQSRQLALLT